MGESSESEMICCFFLIIGRRGSQAEAVVGSAWISDRLLGGIGE